MKLGVVFPQTEIDPQPAAVKQWALSVEGLDFDHMLAFDHVLGAPPERLEALGRPPFYTDESSFLEPLVLFGFVAAITERLGLVSDVIILPQRQTALVAKQASVVDRLSGGRLRLGVGLGWNFAEYEALGENFRTRGRRISEQVEVMRRLWTEQIVTFDGEGHRLDRVGLCPRPVQQPIPIWMGGGAEPVLQRMARLADGWFPPLQPVPEAAATIERLKGLIAGAGRDPATFGIEGRVSVAAGGGPDDWVERADAWRALGATHLSLNTMGAGFQSLDQHLDAAAGWKAAMAAL